MIQTQQKIIESLTAQNNRLIKKQDELNNQTNHLHNRVKELNDIIATFTKYNINYSSLLQELNICEAEYETAKNDILKIKKKYKSNLKRTMRK